MAIITFANKSCSVSRNRIYPMSELSYSNSLNIEEQEVEGSKPSTYIKNVALKEYSFTISLYKQKSVNVETEIKEWMALCEGKTPHMLIIGGKPACINKMLLTSISVQETDLDRNGYYLRAKLQLQFKEFVRWGSKKEESGTSSESKKSKKRKNSNASGAVALGADDEKKVSSLENEIFGGN